MAKLTVKPLPDGTSMRGNWQVKKSGARKSKHRKKSAAVDRAYSYASTGDRIEIRRLNGSVQDVRTVR